MPYEVMRKKMKMRKEVRIELTTRARDSKCPGKRGFYGVRWMMMMLGAGGWKKQERRFAVVMNCAGNMGQQWARMIMGGRNREKREEKDKREEARFVPYEVTRKKMKIKSWRRGRKEWREGKEK